MGRGRWVVRGRGLWWVPGSRRGWCWGWVCVACTCVLTLCITTQYHVYFLCPVPMAHPQCVELVLELPDRVAFGYWAGGAAVVHLVFERHDVCDVVACRVVCGVFG